MSGIRLGTDWTFKSEGVATQTFGILAVRGAGKSNLAAVMAEEMHRLRIPFVVVDPVGSWWGLRSSSDGKSPGLDVPIFGGRHGDVPLEKTGGQVLADLVVDDRLSCVLDLSEFSESDKIRFLIDFAERLYRRNSEPLHLFLEEADDYIPQRPFREQARLLRAFENIVRRGRARGLGITLITQRSAALNKSVLTQIETLFVLRTTSPQDRKAIEGWIEYHGAKREVLESLPGLRAGEAWIWSPQWLQVMKRVQVRRRETFDSAATPKEFRGARPAARLADVNLDAVKKAMAATIERAKQEDPRELKKRIAMLERELAAKPAAKVETKVETVAVISPKELDRFEKATGEMVAQLALLRPILARANQLPGRPAPGLTPGLAPGLAQRREIPVREPAQRREKAARATAGTANGSLPRAERRILAALAQYPTGRTKRQVALIAAYAINGGGFNNALSALRSTGLIDGSDHLRITDAGLAAIGDAWEPLPTGQALLEHWESHLPKAERLILRALCVPPRAMTKEDLAEHVGYEATGGGFNNALSRLRTLELIEGRGELRAAEELLG